MTVDACALSANPFLASSFLVGCVGRYGEANRSDPSI